MIGRILALGFVVVLAGAWACNGSSMPTSSVDDSTFVRTMVDLQRLADDTTLDSLALDSTRRVILRRNGVTAAELERAARAMAYQPERAERVWTAIANARTPGVGQRRTITPSTPKASLHMSTPGKPSPR